MPEPVSFGAVLAEELELIALRRGANLVPRSVGVDVPASKATEAEARAAASAADLVGLAFSGGGIRSATFNLGVLQALASYGLLGRIDYLSTVSGGGYVGSWLAAWLRREEGLGNVERQLHPNRKAQALACRVVREPQPLPPHCWQVPKRPPIEEEPEPVFHLRQYSNYLSPRLGMFSADSWTLVSIYLRNLLLNLLMLLSVAVLATAVIRLLVWLFALPGDGPRLSPAEYAQAAAAAVLMTTVFVALSQQLNALRWAADDLTWPRAKFKTLILASLGAASLFFVWIVANDAGAADERNDLGRLLRAVSWLPGLLTDDLSLRLLGATAIWFGFVHGAVTVLIHCLDRVTRRKRPEGRRGGPGSAWLDAGVVLCGVASGVVGGALFFLLIEQVIWGLKGGMPLPIWTPELARAVIITIGPPLALGCVVIAVYADVGLLGSLLTEYEREWWTRISAWIGMLACGWLAVFAVSLFAAPLLLWLGNRHEALAGSAAAGWLATTIAGALAGKSPRTDGNDRSRLIEVFTLVAPYVFLVGLAAGVSLLVSLWLGGGRDPGRYFEVLSAPPPGRFAVLAGSAFFLCLLLGWRLDVNLFSLHALYANRLARCYLGASRPKAQWRERIGKPVRRWLPGPGGAPTGARGQDRCENSVTGFDPQDDLPLFRLRIGDSWPEAGFDGGYAGPFQIVNTAMNLVGGDELAWQERKAESFTLTPLYCGSKGTGHRKLGPDSAENLTLGRAVAISGAAANPNMGYHSSPAVTALMTVFNARLGWWLQNPAAESWPGNLTQPRTWNANGPSFGLHLFKELFGRTDEKSRYVHLSDGGHFENLGIYELVRRRCRFIVACDAGADPNYEFADLAGAVRKCRSDFGVRIDIDTDTLRPPDGARHGRWHCAVGRIRYDDADPGAVPGMLVYVKASMTGDEPSDVLNYARDHAAFPHEPTADQFFGESQFESYRALGFHVAAAVFRDAMRDTTAVDRGDPSWVKRFFWLVQSRWFPPPPDLEAGFAEAVEAWTELHDILRENLPEVGEDIYPESSAAVPVGPPVPPSVRHDRSAELHFVARLLKTMETAWLKMRLDEHLSHPLNSGWVNVLHRWTASAAFRRHWPTLRGEHSHQFVRFCEREFGLETAQALVRIDRRRKAADAVAVESLRREFACEWPKSSWPLFRGVFADAARRPPGTSPFDEALDLAESARTAWFVVTPPLEDPRPGGPRRRQDVICGAVLVCPRPAAAGRPPATGGRFELVIWLRGGYRNAGIGREVIRLVFGKLAQRQKAAVFPADFAMRVRFPRRAVTVEEAVERDTWKSFYGLFGFREPDDGDVADENQADLVLEADAAACRELIRRFA